MFKKEGIEKSLTNKENKEELLRLGVDFWVNKNRPYIAKEYFRQGGLTEKEIEHLFKKLDKVITKFRTPPEESNKKIKLMNLKDQERLSFLGISSIEKNPYFAAICLEAGGYSPEQVKPLFELAETKKANEPTPLELDRISKLWLKDLGLASLEKNRMDFAGLCFQKIKIPKKEIESLMKLNLLGIEKERKTIWDKIKKIKSRK